jgi:cholesterol transport system auxiliary component
MNPRTVQFTVAGGLALAALLPGCVNLSKGYPEKHYYVLQASPRAAEARPGDGKGEKEVLKVGRFRVSPLYEGKEFVYRKDDLGYVSDFYNVFFIAPGALITEEVRRWLAGSGRFQHVMDPASHAAGALLLEGAVSSLYGDFREEKNPRAVLEIQAILMRDAEGGGRVIFKKDYRQEAPLPDRKPATLARGWSEGLERILTALEEDLKSAVQDGGR